MNKKFSIFYKDICLIFSNTIICFILLNCLLFVSFGIKDRFFKRSAIENPVEEKYGLPFLKQVYPHLADEQISWLLAENWKRSHMFESFTQFRERPLSGRFVNVDKNGFRVSKNQGPWPPNRERFFNIFIFGGSTAFNYGVSDEETIASYLQEFISAHPGLEKEVRIYNFGRGFYYSSQERILFEKLISDGFIPDVAIFIDGLNDFETTGEPMYTKELTMFMDGEIEREFANRNLYKEIFMKLPITRLIHFLKDKKFAPNESFASVDSELHFKKDDKSVTGAIERYLNNKKMIEAVSGVFGVKPVFVWQPIPFYKYDLPRHLFRFKANPRSFATSRDVYPRMRRFIEENPIGVNFLWCAEIQENLKEELYVDVCHYNSKMSRLLASHIFDFLLEKNLLPIK